MRELRPCDLLFVVDSTKTAVTRGFLVNKIPIEAILYGYKDWLRAATEALPLRLSVHFFVEIT